MMGKVVEASAILALAGLTANAALRLHRALRAPPPLRRQELPGALVWFALCVQAIDAWPAGTHPWLFPATAMRMVLPVAGLPFVLAAARPGSARVREWAQRASAAALLGILGLLLWSGLRWLLSVRPVVGGIDFWYYVCYARDFADGIDFGDNRGRSYFPGVYWFWRAALALTGRSIAGLQRIYVGVLAINVTLVGLLSFRATRSRLWTLVAVTWLLLLLARLEGEEGCTEPIAAACALAGLYAWRPSRRGALLLGVGLGSALLAKQTGGLLSLGWLGLAVCAASRGEVRTLLWVPIAAIATAAVGLLPGATSVGRGLAMVAGSYPADGTFTGNVTGLLRYEWSLPLGLLAGIAGLALLSRGNDEAARRRRALLAFSTIAALSTLAQFQRRGYLHYALLTAPFAVVAGVAGLSGLWRRLRAGVAPDPILAFSLAAVLAVALVHAAPRFPQSPFSFEPSPLPPAWPDGTPAATDLMQIAAHVKQGEDLVLLPPERNKIHFMLGTRPLSLASGYGFGLGSRGIALGAAAAVPGASGMGLAAVRSPSVHSVIAVAPMGPGSAVACAEVGCDEALRALPGLGFRKVVEGTSMTLWKRP